MRGTRPHAGGDEHGARLQLRALRGTNREAAFGQWLDGVHLLAQVPLGCEDLAQQALGQLWPVQTGMPGMS